MEIDTTANLCNDGAVSFDLFADLGYRAMRLLSRAQEQKYRTQNINPNMDEFYKAEEKCLFKQSNTLLQFINFIQEDANNADKLFNVRQAIQAIVNRNETDE